MTPAGAIPNRCRLRRLGFTISFILIILRSLYRPNPVPLQGLLFSGWNSTDVAAAAIMKPTTTPQRVQIRLRPGRQPFPNAYNGRYICRLRSHLPLQAPLIDLLPFQPRIEMNLSVVVLGDSVGMQIAGAYQRVSREQGYPRDDLLHEHGYEIVTHSRTSQHGHVFGWRVTGLLRPQGEDLPIRSRNIKGGWNREQVELILNRTNSIDAVIYRLPQGWLELKDITYQSLNETVRLVHDLLGMSVLTFLTFPIINNYESRESLIELHETNELIRGFAEDWNEGKLDSLPYIFIISFGELIMSAARKNAEIIGLANATSDHVFSQRVMFDAQAIYSSPAALVCADPPTKQDKSNTSTCHLNQLSVDGVHPCMENFAGRLFGGIACQHACLFNHHVCGVISCAQKCDRDYMSLQPIDTRLIHS